MDMDFVIVLAGVVLVPILVGGALARWTAWPRWVVALLGGAPLPLVALVIIVADYIDLMGIPPERCGFSCGLSRSLSPTVMMIAGGGLVIAVIIAFVTAAIVRRRLSA